MAAPGTFEALIAKRFFFLNPARGDKFFFPPIALRQVFPNLGLFDDCPLMRPSRTIFLFPIFLASIHRATVPRFFFSLLDHWLFSKALCGGPPWATAPFSMFLKLLTVFLFRPANPPPQRMFLGASVFLPFRIHLPGTSFRFQIGLSKKNFCAEVLWHTPDLPGGSEPFFFCGALFFPGTLDPSPSSATVLRRDARRFFLMSGQPRVGAPLDPRHPPRIF